MTKDIKTGDIVETCSLMPGIVMSINGDDIYVRMLDIDEYNTGSPDSFANCSLSHCGIVKLSSRDALKRMYIGKAQLSVMYKESTSYAQYVESINTLFEKHGIK